MDAPPPPVYAAAAPDLVVPLARLRDHGEARFLGPGGTPRLVQVGRGAGTAPAIVFIHGFTGDPANQTVMIAEARARGMAAWVMAYDTLGKTVAANSAGFASELAALAAGGTRDLTIVAHSLGAVTLKAALDGLDSGSTALPFRRMRVVTISTPWRGIGGLATMLRAAGGRGLPTLVSDLAPDSPTLRSVQARPWPIGVVFEDVVGSHDPVRWLAGPGAGPLPWAGRVPTVVAGTSHNTVLWANPTLAVVFEEPPARWGSLSQSPLWRTAIDEAAAVLGLPGAFGPRLRKDQGERPESAQPPGT